MAKKIDHICDVCGEDFDELLTYKGYEHSSLIVWTCESCFEIEFGSSYEEIE